MSFFIEKFNLKHLTAHLLSFSILGGISIGLGFLLQMVPAYFYVTAILSVVMMVSVKLTAMFVHGPEVRRLSTRMTSSESKYESSLQLMVVLAICLNSGKVSKPCASSLASSIVMIGKSGAESYLTFGSENLIEQTGRGKEGLLKKLKLFGSYAPVFIATTSARLTALAVVFTWEPLVGFLLLLPLSVLGPIVLFLLMKCCALKDLSVVDLVKAVIGEQTTHCLWGGRGREGSRRLQLFMQIYLLVLHSIFMVPVLLPVLVKEKGLTWKLTDEVLERVRILALVSLVAGWPSMVVLTYVW